MKKGIKCLLVLLMSIYWIPTNVFAAVGSITISGTTMNVGEEKTLTIGLPSNIASVDGTITSDDPTCVEVVSVTSPSGSGNYFMAITMTTAPLADGGTVKIKGLKNCETTLSISNASMATQAEEEETGLSFKSGTIKVGSSTPTPPVTEPTEPTQPSSEPTSGGGSTPTPKSSDSSLKDLVVEGFTLSPEFAAGTTEYTIEVPEDATQLIIDATKNDSKATVSGAGTITIDGDTATVRVTAEDGSHTDYKINIKRKESTKNLDGNNKLKTLDISGYSINPSFDPSKNTYTMNVANSVTGLTVNAVAESENAKVTIIGATGWKEGVNVVKVRVTAENGDVNEYTINVTRAGSGNTTAPQKSNDNNLSGLLIKSAHTMEPKEFDKDVTTYNITVPYDVDKLDLSTTLSNSKAKYTVTGNENFKVGEVNVVQIVVTAEDGSQKIYTLNVTRSTEVDKTDVKEITIGGGYSLDPKFDPKKLTYTVNVKPGTTELDVSAIPADPNSKVEIVGNKNLKYGENTVLVKVTDENGFVKYYTLNVVRPERKILGLSPLQFGIVAGIIGLLLFLLLFILFKRRKKEEDPKNVNVKVDEKKEAPVIEFKPEFNFNSRNGTDDDVVFPNATLNQGSTTQKDVSYMPNAEEKKILDYKDADYNEVPYDPYDDIVTKDELIDAINEGLESHNPEKLKMLLEQEELNRKKEELRKKEEEANGDR